MKTVVLLFVSDHVVVQQYDAFVCFSQLRKMHYGVEIEVSNEAITILLESLSVFRELTVRHLQFVQKGRVELIGIADKRSPMMSAILFDKQLAPLKDTNVEKVPVTSNPKLFFEDRESVLPTGNIKRKISQKVAAQYAGAPEAG